VAASGPYGGAGAPRWPGTLLYVPVLYGLGWLLSRPLGWLAPGWRPDQVNLVGVALALLLLLLTLPWRLRRCWGCDTPWRRLGVAVPTAAGLRALLRGLLKALLLLALVVTALVMAGQARWLGSLEPDEALNAVALVLGVGFAEELLFRGWLWGELDLVTGPRRALLLQAVVFGLIHPWARAPGLGAVGLLGGLILLGVVLGLQRRADDGILWGAIGLHGGLVGGWFALQAGLLELSPEAPGWLAGPGGASPNPIGGLIGWLGLAALLLARRQYWDTGKSKMIDLAGARRKAELQRRFRRPRSRQR
jgi:membrane protease YdiL (CAAX protease family)